MLINAASTLSQTLVSSTTQTSSSLTSSGGSSTSSSIYDPAYLLSGSTETYTQGLYNSLGTMLDGTASATTAEYEDTKRTEELNNAAELIDAGYIQEGREIANTLLSKDGTDVTAIRLIGLSYLSEGNYQDAERFYARAAALAPSSETVATELATAQVFQKSDDEVLTEANRRIKSEDYRDQGIQMLLQLTTKSPDNMEAYLALVDAYELTGESTMAFAAMQEAVSIADSDSISEVIQKASAMADEYSDIGLAHNILGRSYQKAGRYREAINELQKATSIAPDNYSYTQDLAAAYVQRGLEKLDAGDGVSAQSDLHSAQALTPSAGGVSDLEARVEVFFAGRDIVAGRYRQAYAKLNSASISAPDDEKLSQQMASLYSSLGSQFKKEGEDSLALSAYKKAYQLDDSKLTARINVANIAYEMGMEAHQAGSHNAAISYLEDAYDAMPDNVIYKQDLASAYNARGELNLAIGKYDDALADFRRAFELDPSNSTVSDNLSEALGLVD